jgi:hypothetical protein
VDDISRLFTLSGPANSFLLLLYPGCFYNFSKLFLNRWPDSPHRKKRHAATIDDVLCIVHVPADPAETLAGINFVWEGCQDDHADADIIRLFTGWAGPSSKIITTVRCLIKD